MNANNEHSPTPIAVSSGQFPEAVSGKWVVVSTGQFPLPNSGFETCVFKDGKWTGNYYESGADKPQEFFKIRKWTHWRYVQFPPAPVREDDGFEEWLNHYEDICGYITKQAQVAVHDYIKWHASRQHGRRKEGK